MGSMQFNSKLQLYLLTIHVGRTTRVRYIRLKKMKNCGRFVPDGGGGGGYTWEFLVGVCRPVHKIYTLFQTKKCPFPHPFSVLASKKLCHQFAKMRTPTTNFFKSIWNLAYYSFFLIHLES